MQHPFAYELQQVCRITRAEVVVVVSHTLLTGASVETIEIPSKSFLLDLQRWEYQVCSPSFISIWVCLFSSTQNESERRPDTVFGIMIS